MFQAEGIAMQSPRVGHSLAHSRTSMAFSVADTVRGVHGVPETGVVGRTHNTEPC